MQYTHLLFEAHSTIRTIYILMILSVQNTPRVIGIKVYITNDY